MSACAQFPQTTPLFAKTLKAAGGDDPHGEARDLLRMTLLKMRERAHFLVSFIPADIPGLTVHDVSHLDALWDMAAKIAGDNYDLTPAEAFVLGGAILLHDAALSVASYPDGLAGVKATVEWDDVAATLARDGVAEADIEKRTLPTVLRLRHAAQAEIIATTPFKRKPGSPEEYLIDDGELRQFYGRIIGKIAHSHWRSVSELETTLGKKLTRARGLPNGWTVDPVKVACLLRVADAAHLSASRAPSFLMTLTKPTDVSDIHWTFQNKLGEPEVEGDKLIYSSGSDVFGLNEADAWWLCFDSLNMVQDELRAVDILLADTDRPRFQVREVAGVGSPTRLKEHVLVEGWEPVDARVTISDVPTLVRTLGGAQLYGDDNSVPLRELMQNACDAVRARRFQQNKDEKWGTITVRLIEDHPEGVWLEVLDDGVGMSERVLTGPLLDFGKSFWRSSLANEEFPGLAKKFADAGKEQTGRFGIGFYSVFMLGDRVTVTSRPYRGAESATKTLDFRTGLSSRPLLRFPAEDERMDEPGTRVRVLLHKKPFEEGGLWWRFKERATEGDYRFSEPERILAFMAPAIDANLDFIGMNGKVRCVEANDWLTMEGEALGRRLLINSTFGPTEFLDEKLKNACSRLHLVGGDRKNPLARIAIYDGQNSFAGVVTSGGFYSNKVDNVVGVIKGHHDLVSRNKASVHLPKILMSDWSTKQSLLLNFNTNVISQDAVYTIIGCGGKTQCINAKKITKDRYIEGEYNLLNDLRALNKIIVFYYPRIFSFSQERIINKYKLIIENYADTENMYHVEIDSEKYQINNRSIINFIDEPCIGKEYVFKIIEDCIRNSWGGLDIEWNKSSFTLAKEITVNVIVAKYSSPHHK